MIFKTKEIVRGDKELTFKGKPHFVLTLMSPLIHDTFKDAFSESNPILEQYISDEEYSEFSSDVESLVGDPSYQSHIIEMVADSIDSFWKYKKLGSTWIETKAEAMKTLDEHLIEALGKVEIQVSVYYNVDVFGSSVTTGKQVLGKISGEKIKACAAFESLLNTARPYVVRRMEEDMKPLIENDEAKIENDMMMLNILLKKYPNYKEILETQTK